MKIIYTFCCLAFCITNINAQVSFSQSQLETAVSYTFYKSQLQQNAYGGRFKLLVPVAEKVHIGIGYSFSNPMKFETNTLLSPIGLAPSTTTYKFSGLHLNANFYLQKPTSKHFQFYLPVGVTYQMVEFEEQLKQLPPNGFTPINMTPQTNETGWLVNFGPGIAYSYNKIQLFTEAQICFPISDSEYGEVKKVIPLQFGLFAGLRFSLKSAPKK
ncbi:hypothetical protein [Phnomibacter sp. MR]|uniref:hypothetical protein n=1 Tax=Phnomibacter sp. MR TaxID=3042318 RepID=UPI003A807F2F